MFSRNHHLARERNKNKQVHTNLQMKFSISSFFFLTFLFFGLICLCWFQPTRTNSNSSQYDRKLNKLPSQSAPPLCQENVSVYVYELPAKFNLGLLNDCRHLNVYRDMCPHVANSGLGQPVLLPDQLGSTTSWFATNQFTAEMIFHARLQNHPCRTMDPKQANLFYVPFYAGLHASSKFREPDRVARDALAVELSEYIRNQWWWQERKGNDHFVVLGRTAWDFMRKTNDGPDFGANRLLHLPPLQNMSVLTIERHPWEGSNQHGIPYPSYFHPSSSHEILTWQDRMARMERPHLFSFVGAPRTGVKKAAIRDDIIHHCAESARCKLLKCGPGASECHNPSEVLNVMTRSQFCLQAPGDSFTRRSTFDSVLAGCIPVFFSPHTAYSQYAWYLPADPTTYSVYIDGERNGTKRMEEELLKIPMHRAERMRKTVINLIPAFTYMHPNSTTHEFRDAVDVALAALSEHTVSKLRD